MSDDTDLDALVAEHVMGWKCTVRDCDGKFLTRCGACGKEGHGNCYGNGSGAIQVSCVGRGHRPNYSGDIAAAWEVVKRLSLLREDRGHPAKDGRSAFYKPVIRLELYEHDGEYECRIGRCKGFGDDDVSAKVYERSVDEGRFEDEATYAMCQAICLAALKAVGVEVPE